MQVIRRRLLIILLAAASLVLLSYHSINASAFSISNLLNKNTVETSNDLPNFVELVKKAAPAVVNISTTREGNNSPVLVSPPIPEIFKRFFGDQIPFDIIPFGQMQPPRSELRSLGSGFIISPDGYILTNAHVVANANRIRVRLNDRRELDAKLIGTDRKTDVALIKINANNLPILNIGNSDTLQTGEWVAAIGSPFGFDHSITQGIVSAINRTLPSDAYVPFIQTDVAINPGNSGGPLFNMKGQVVGINSQIYTRSGGFMGLSFAIPINVAMDIADQLRHDGRVHRGWLGVVIQPVSEDLASSFGLKTPTGALISQLTPDGPAEKGGLKAGDIVLSVNDNLIRTSDALPREIGKIAPGHEVSLKILRDGKEQVLNLKVGDWPSDGADQNASDENQQMNLGISVAPLSAAQASAAKIPQGVFIQQVDPRGKGAQMGLQPGDIIININRQVVDSVDKLKEILKKLPQDKAVPMLISRENMQLYLALKFEAKKK